MQSWHKCLALQVIGIDDNNYNNDDNNNQISKELQQMIATGLSYGVQMPMKRG